MLMDTFVLLLHFTARLWYSCDSRL